MFAFVFIRFHRPYIYILTPMDVSNKKAIMTKISCQDFSENSSETNLLALLLYFIIHTAI